MAKLDIEIGQKGNGADKVSQTIDKIITSLDNAEKYSETFNNSLKSQQGVIRAYESAIKSLIGVGFTPLSQSVQSAKSSVDALTSSIDSQKRTAAQQQVYDSLSTKLKQIGANQALAADDIQRWSALIRANQTAIDSLIKQGIDPADASIKRLQADIKALRNESDLSAAQNSLFKQFQKTGQIIPDLQTKIQRLKHMLASATNEQNIIKYNIKLKEAQAEMQRLATLGIKAADSAKAISAVASQSSSGISGIKSLIGGYIGLSSAINQVSRAFSSAMQSDALSTSFGFILRDSEERLLRIREQADRLGQQYLTLGQTYRKFTAAAEASNFSLSLADKIFNSVANAGAKLKLSNEQVEGTFLAIEQMISKGTVSMEELRRQLGDRLPGAFSLAARAMGMTEQAFNKAVASGSILAADLLPKLADEIDKQYGATTKNIVSLQASVNRLKNEFDLMVQDSNVQRFFRGVVDEGKNLLGIFRQLVTTRLSSALNDEQVALNAMRIELESANTSSDRRLELIQKLKSEYPEFLSKIDAEKATNSELVPILEKINSEYGQRIAYQKLMEAAGEKQNTLAQVQLDRFKAQQRVIKDIAQSEALAAELGVKFRAEGENEFERAQDVISRLSDTIIHNTETTGANRQQIASLVKSLTTGVQYIEMYDGVISGLSSDFDAAKQEADDFAKSVGMIDGTANGATKQLTELQSLMLKIMDSGSLKRGEKDALANRLAAAGYDKETQRAVLLEVEKLENERRAKSGKEVKKTVDYLAQIASVAERSQGKADTSGLLGLDLDTAKIMVEYQKLYTDLNQIEAKVRADQKLSAENRAAALIELDKTRAQLGIDEAQRQSDAEIAFAEKSASKLEELSARAGITRIKSRQQELAQDAAYWNQVEANMIQFGITAEQLTELRKASEARINSDWDAKMFNTGLTYQRRFNETQTQIATRQLNDEYKAKEKSLEDWVAAQRGAGKDAIEIEAGVNQRRIQLQNELFAKYEELYAKQRELDIQTAFDGDALSVPLARINDAVTELRRNFQGLSQTEITEFQTKIAGLEMQRQQLQLFQGTVDDISGAFGNLYADAIFDTENALQNLTKAAESMAKNILSGLIKIGARYLINMAIGKASMASTAVASSATAATVASAWATAAALVSAASYGANVAAGGAALAGLIASTKALAGFSQGGYTGNGGIRDVAGVVHGKEFVFNAAATQRIGVDNLMALQRGNIPSGLSSALPHTAISKGGNNAVTVNVVGEISGETIKLVADRANRSYNRYF